MATKSSGIYEKQKRDIWYHFDRALDIADRGAGVASKYAGPLGALAALVNIEKKYYDIASGLTGVVFTTGAAGPFSLTANLPQGVAQSQCIGNSIKLLSCFLKFRIISNSSSSTGITPQPVRIICVSDRDANGAAPAISDVLQTSSATNGGFLLSPLNKTTSFASGQAGRFAVLMDEVVIAPFENGGGGSGFHDRYWDQHNKFGDDHHCLWSSDTHSPSTILGGHIFFWVLWADVVVSSVNPTYTFDTTNPPGVQWYSRIRYTDD